MFSSDDPQTPTNNDKVKILVLGDTGVGKTSVLHLLCHQKVLQNPQWTVGAHFEVMLHKYKQHPTEFFIEFWDIGGAKKYALSRHLFYKDSRSGPKWNYPNSGLILVHDLSNKKSYGNLKKWLDEITVGLIDENQQFTWGKTNNNTILELQFDNGSDAIPVLIVGNKLDLINKKGGLRTSSCDGEELGRDEIHISANNPATFTAGSQAMLTMSAFFDKVIYRQHFKNQHHMYRNVPSPGTPSPFKPNPPMRFGSSFTSFFSPNRSTKQSRKIDSVLLKAASTGVHATEENE